MNLLAWVLFGLITGIVANAIDPQPSSGGILGSIILGVFGAFVGGFLATMIFGVGITGFNVTSFVVAIAGSLLLLIVGRALRRV